MVNDAVLIARGLHPPWNTGIASYGRIVLEALKEVYGNLTLALTPDWHRVSKDELVTFIENLRGEGIDVTLSGRSRVVLGERGRDYHILKERLLAVGSGGRFKYLYVRPPRSLERLFLRLAFKLPVYDYYILSSPSLASIYRLKTHLTLPPYPRYVEEWPECEPPEFIDGVGEYLVYIGWLIPQRVPLRQIKRVLGLSEYSIVLIGRESEELYGEHKYMKILKESLRRYRSRIIVANKILSECEKRALLEASRGLLFPLDTPYPDPPIIEPPLIVVEALYLGVRVYLADNSPYLFMGEECDLISRISDLGSKPSGSGCKLVQEVYPSMLNEFQRRLKGGLT